MALQQRVRLVMAGYEEAERIGNSKGISVSHLRNALPEPPALPAGGHAAPAQGTRGHIQIKHPLQ